MAPRTEAQKKAQLKWIEKNKEIYAESQRLASAMYYYNNRTTILEKRKNKKLQEQMQSETTI